MRGAPRASSFCADPGGITMTVPAYTSTETVTCVSEALPSIDTVVDALDAAVLVVDRTGRIRFRNASATSWLSAAGHLQAVFVDARWLEPFPGWEAVITGICDTGSPVQMEGVVDLSPHAESERVTVRCSSYRRSPGQPADGIVVLLERHGAQRDVARRLDMSARLTSLGKIAARVAHELNNPLDGILRYINLSLRVADEAPDSKLKDYLSESRTGLMRMIQIIGDLLEYTRGSGEVGVDVGINGIVEQAIGDVRTIAGGKAVSITFDAAAPNRGQAGGARLHQVLCNLLRNAIDATPAGGQIKVRTEANERALSIRVSDTGGGLSAPPEKIFEPFFTTKPTGQGTGLGLAICREFIAELGGHIDAHNGEQGGAVFTVILPNTGGARSSQPEKPTWQRK